MHKKTITCMIALTLFAGGMTACGSDSDGTKTTSAPAGTTATGGTDAGGGTDSANPDVQKFCDDAKALADQLKEVIADPTKGDMVALSAKATELSTSAAQLISANASDAAKINECAQVLTTAASGG